MVGPISSRISTARATLPAKTPAEIRHTVLATLGRLHGMRAADPAPTAQVKLSKEKDGTRAWAVVLGNYAAKGTYDVAKDQVHEQSWTRI